MTFIILGNSINLSDDFVNEHADKTGILPERYNRELAVSTHVKKYVCQRTPKSELNNKIIKSMRREMALGML